MLIQSNATDIGARIRQIRQSKQMTQKIFSESLGIVQGFLCSIERGKKMPSDTLLIAMQYLYRINSSWLYSGTGEMYSLEKIYESGGLTRIPLLKNLAKANSGDVHEDEIIGFISLPDMPDNSFAIEYSGDFMSPTIRDGDIIVITPDRSLTPGKIVLIMGQWGEPFLRRYRSRNGEIFFTADNSAYSPFKPDSTTNVLGIVAAVWRKVNI